MQHTADADLNPVIALRDCAVGTTVDCSVVDDGCYLASLGYDKFLEDEEQLMAARSVSTMPGLQDTAQGGVLHVVTCPHCNNRLAVDDRWRPSKVED